MLTMSKTPLGEWLERQFLKWQNERGERQTIDAFAQYIGVTRVALNRWMNGVRTPSADYADQIADKLGPEIYDLLGLPRPDPRLQAIIRQWGALPETVKNDLVKRAETNQRSTLEPTDQPVASAKRK